MPLLLARIIEFIEVQLAMTNTLFCMFVIIIYNLCVVITFNGSEIKN